MSNEPQTPSTPGSAFFSLALGLGIYSLFGVLPAPIDPAWRWMILIFGTLSIWFGIVDMLRLGGGWIAWGAISMLTLGLGSALSVVLSLLTVLK